MYYKFNSTIMAKKTNESTFGARIQNAQSLVIKLKSFNQYVPLRKEDDISELQDLINTIQKMDYLIYCVEKPMKKS